MAELSSSLSCESLKSDLRQVVKETLCQELSEVANRVHQAVREEIQCFIERWFSEYDVRAPKRCDGHEPLKALGQGPSQALPASSVSALFASLPALTAPAAAAAESSSASPSTSVERKTEDDKRVPSDTGRLGKRCSTAERKVPLIRPEIQRDICAKSSAAAPSALESGAPSAPSSSSSDLHWQESNNSPECRGDSSSKSDAKAQADKATYSVSPHYAPVLMPADALEKIQEAGADDREKEKETAGKKDRKISFSDFDEPSPKKSSKQRSPSGKESIYRDFTKVVPLPEIPNEDAKRTLDRIDTSLVSTEFLRSQEQEHSAEASEAEASQTSADTWNMEDQPQWVMDIQKTIRTCTTQIFERERCRPPEWWIRIVESAWFDYFATSFVILNAITIGVQADWSVRNLHLHESPPPFFNITEKVFCIVFTVELLMRVSIHGILFFSVPGWKWNVFDTIVVTLQLVEELVNILAAGNEDGESSSFDTSNFNFVRVLRVLRLLRVFRIVRIVRFVSELRTMVCSIANSMRSLFWTVILIFLMIYVVGVYLTQLVSDHGAEHPEDMGRESLLRERYGGLGVSILSLFQAMTGGVDWEDLVNPLMEEITPLLGIIFTVYIAFAVLAMMNVVTAVFIETALQNANKDKDTDTQTCLRKFIQSDEAGQDESIDETITWEDFKQRLRNPTKKSYFRALDLEIAEAKGLFQLLDTEGDGIIQVEEFVSWFLQLRGPAKAIDLATVMYNQKRLGTDWAKHAQFVEETLLDILNTMPGKLGRTIRASGQEPPGSRRQSVQWPAPVMGALSTMRNSCSWHRKSNQRDSRKSVASVKGSTSQSPKQASVYSVMAETGAESSDLGAAGKKK